jgi:RNA polymerase-binding transcription factor DksA
MNKATALVRLGEEERDLLVLREELQRERSDLSGTATRGDRMLEEQEQDEGLVRDIDRSLDEIASARDRIENGTYGRCEVCTGHIPEERLLAVPYTRQCAFHVIKTPETGGVV